MPLRQHEPLLRTSSFEVLIGDRELGFAQVGRLTSETDLATFREQRVHRFATVVHRFATVVLRRALSDSTELYDWRMAIIAGKDDRRDVTIRQLTGPGGEVANAWRLVRAWPCRWSGPAFDALTNDIAWEELELTFDDLVWLDRDPRNTGG